MNALLDKLKHDNDLNLNPVDRWELTKCEIRNYCVDFGKRLACNQRNKKIELQKHMHTLEHFVNDMNALLDKLKHDNDLNLNPVDRWELTKCEIRNYCVDFGKRLACNQRNKKIELQKHMHTLELAIVKYPESIYLQNDSLRVSQTFLTIRQAKSKRCLNKIKN
eukprot:TRINITY_DN49110_c0_g1_i2.p1 TRINITY_DN49110_c0_g1~~TRINITY_DN49110_c0_g1_i2.p1  ORF type:complete len:164 (-),score=14.60 TRINITY_DN49110_c0_g1_i2:43-534(-)